MGNTKDCTVKIDIPSKKKVHLRLIIQGDAEVSIEDIESEVHIQKLVGANVKNLLKKNKEYELNISKPFFIDSYKCNLELNSGPISSPRPSASGTETQNKN